ncbi:lytic transglycosylase F [Vibrio renipiscarius]|uniref:Amino acid ABC transporter substrate-binding protein n=1 Tax=Vibrio renipiscarius TaxID=1461322 RepID=A0A0C2NCR0_9VIBR|nr:lytic transglycosylase F [Vibrio renipiscarius]KII77411.1 amino acid ABC transporter substrate-binding protein [Vibrio renipiscarius]KII81422.1 amino acid ABC transporter substrate-binding protein [Vibrio renipiscarius]
MIRALSITLLLILLPLQAWAISLAPLQKEPHTGDLSVLEKKGLIRVLVSADLGFYYIEAGQPKGIIAELLYDFEKQLKQRSSYFNLQVIPVNRNELIPSLEKGYGDLVVANLTITEPRKKSISFSEPILKDIQEWIITSKKTPQLYDISQLSGKDVWVRKSSSYYESLQKVNQRLHTLNKPLLNIRLIDETLQDIEIIELVNQGHINATVLDSHKSKLWIDVMDDIHAHKQLPLRSDGEIAWAMRQNSPQLKALVDQYLTEYRSGTLLGNVIYGKYLGDSRWLKKILNPKNIQQLKSLSKLFNQYSAQYNFDPLMISAQSFQESGLDQSKVSHQGAVGIMQVLPSTARDPNVNIPNINKLENNIHAGVKYLRFLKDRYFSDDAITADNQVYFSLAAYNAGPGNIRKMRRLAEKQGYDPNVWFKNVEIIARRNIGREPVHYVSNINRYFIIYKQLAALQEMRDAANDKKLNPMLFPIEMK